ncbi:predicted protein, partial [Nematostella vectensis]
TTTKTLLVRNIGNKEARFQLLVEEPFFVTPESGRLPIGESLQIHVDFKAMQTGDHNTNMFLTKKKLGAILFSLKLNTINKYISNSYTLINISANHTTICVFARNPPQHAWQRYVCVHQDEDPDMVPLFYMDLRMQEGTERDIFLEECLSDLTIRDQLSVISRKYKNQVQVLNDDKLLFDDDIITVDPVEGDIWPNSQAEIEIIFKPQESHSYARTLYCDVSGRESRLPLRVRGEGIGPRVQFSFDTLDIGNVFVNSKHSYECSCLNRSSIRSFLNPSIPLAMLLVSMLFLLLITRNSLVMPAIHFCSPILGDFDELFSFAIEGSPEKLKLNIRGSVIGPTFHFNVPKLRFGTISYG